MKNVFIKIKYKTNWGESIKITGLGTHLGNWDKEKSQALSYLDSSTWGINIQIPQSIDLLEFKFYITKDGKDVRHESGDIHTITLPLTNTEIECLWNDKIDQSYFLTSAFRNSIFKHEYNRIAKNQYKSFTLLVTCVHIEAHQELIISGDDEILGSWDSEKAISLSAYAYGRWYLNLDINKLPQRLEYKFAIRDKGTQRIKEWEDGENRILNLNQFTHSLCLEQRYNKEEISWTASGVALPIFSLRSENSFGIGEFTDLYQLVNWAVKCKMRLIQTLPINDTSSSFTWADSYPYNAISNYALHPIYLGLHQFPLKDKTKNKYYLELAEVLNRLSSIDYEKVIRLKRDYIDDLYNEIGKETLNSTFYLKFYERNKEWLFPYASFCHLRDRFETSRIADWGEYSIYNASKLKDYIQGDKKAQEDVSKTFFTQFLLHKQLLEAKAYAYKKGLVLKGDIPIGVSPNSVEVWTEPHLFHLDCQTGAPPDDFSINGQNWGFPTYNWAEMKKDNFRWWTKRFTKMADYFDAYRIDHILGFFRIWEIPNTSIHGLLGYFSPALPLTPQEINNWGVHFDQKMTSASIHKDDITRLFSEYAEEVIDSFLNSEGDYYTLKEEYNNQKKIKAHFRNETEYKNLLIRDWLYNICNEVLFIEDKYQEGKYHPRISINKTLRFNRLTNEQRNNLYKLYENYFYNRHSFLWKEEALSKLPTLISSTDMLVCGEDLGMVPESVPDVMKELKILSLEIQRMPRALGVKFGDLKSLPYLSVATTSTHDMSPIRMWWEENLEDSQEYYTNMLHLRGEAPKECNTLICMDILYEHLKSPAMLTILPLQDWLSISDKVRRENPSEERINIPADPNHNWNYRMHLTLEELIKEEELVKTIYTLNEGTGR